jgi:cytochrome c-type biogenesis protein
MIQNSQLIIPAFISGLLTFFAPCTLPLLPGYLAYLTGGDTTKRSLLRGALSFIAGFTIVFVLFGLLAGTASHLLLRERSVLGRLGGLFIFVLGLSQLGVLRWPSIRVPSFAHTLPGRPLSGLLLGATFGLTFSPCVGPVLGAVLTLAAGSGTGISGALLMLVYSAGLGIPLVLVALFGSGLLAGRGKLARVLQLISGVVLVVVGVLMVIGLFQQVMGFIVHMLGFGLNPFFINHL